MRSFTRGTIKFLLLAAVFVVFSVAAEAQSTKSTPKPLATPPILTGAEIISQATDYDGPMVTKAPSSPKTDDKTVDKSATPDSARIKELTDRLNKLESPPKNDYEEKQKRMMLNLDILTRAEQRSESLRKQLFEMIEKESTVRTRLEQIDMDSRPEMIERTLQMNGGSMRPEEIREAKRRSLLAEKANLQSLLADIQSTRASLSLNLSKSEEMVEKLRSKLEKDIDDSFLKDEKPDN
ncbi:MAG TPA: hypothetical protein VHQ01_05495 [Pyrinomonadaceae bacterium]|nr:hypothetical protein [Pyrinomonadaceae bacterium]